MISKEVQAGQAVYSRGVLWVYDLWVHGMSNHFLWKCPTQKMVQFYNQHVSGNHLDVGVGTGYFLDRCGFPISKPRLALMDLNENTLRFCAKRLERYQPEVYVRNILEPIAFDQPKFDSIGMNYLLHCLPGDFQTKGDVFKHLRALLKSNGVLFGSTLLQQGVSPNKAAQWLMNTYNKKGIFCNRHDSLEVLKKQLKLYFSEVSIQTVGCVAFFWSKNRNL